MIHSLNNSSHIKWFHAWKSWSRISSSGLLLADHNCFYLKISGVVATNAARECHEVSLKKHSVVPRLVKLKRNPEQWSLTWQLPFELKKQFRQHLMKNIHFCWHEHVNCKMSHFLNSGSRIQWFHACKSWKGISSSGVLLSVASPDCSWHLVKMICFVPPDSAGECLDFSSMYSVVSRLQMLDRGLV